MDIKTCPRCKSEYNGPNKRCADCSAYARKWQKNRTKIARQSGKCITCMVVCEKSRCTACTKSKSQSYQGSKNILASV